MPLPTFLIIGAGRSGTTSLHHYLQQHPAVFMSPVKEPNYFALIDTTTLEGPGAHWVRDMSTTRLDAYEALFAGVTTQTAIGEASPRYLPSPVAAAAIRDLVPAARLVAILRDPAERAHAGYLGSRRDGFEPLASFEAALDACRRGERERWAFMDYTKSGFYHCNLMRYYERFDPEQIRVYLFEDLQHDARGLLRDVFSFIGVNAAFEPDISHRFGRTGLIRNPIVGALWRRSIRLRRALRPFAPRALRDGAVALATADLEKPVMKPETHRHLRSLYREDTLKLQDLLRRDLGAWLSEPPRSTIDAS